MKKTQFVMIIFFLFACLNDSYGFMNYRYQWWKGRVNKIETEKINLSKHNDLDKSVFELLNKELKRTKEAIRIFEISLKDDGSLSSVKKKFSKDEIKETIYKIVSPVFASHLLEYILKRAGSNENLADAITVIRENIANRLEHELNLRDEEFINIYFKDRISRNDLKYISLEVLFIYIGRERDRLFLKAERNIGEFCYNKIKNTEKLYTQKQMEFIVTAAAIKYFKGNQFADNAVYSGNDLKQSWCWAGLAPEISKDIKACKFISKACESAGKDLTISEIYSYYKDPESFNRMLFTEISNKYINKINKRNPGIQKERDSANNDYKEQFYSMKIPGSLKLNKVLKEIDLIRDTFLIKINGKEKDQEFGDLESELDEILKSYSQNKKNKFYLEEDNLFKILEKLITGEYDGTNEHKIKGLENGKLIIANENEFNNARRHFYTDLKFAHDYKTKTIEFLQWLSGIRKTVSADIVARYKNRTGKNKIYLDFLELTIQDCKGLANIESKNIHNNFTYSVQNMPNVIKAIEYSISLSRKEQVNLNSIQLKDIKIVKSGMLKTIKEKQNNIRNTYLDYKKLYKEKNRLKKITDRNVQKRIAEYEIELIYNKVQEYLSSYKKMNYCSHVFSRYSELYNKLEMDVKKDRGSQQLDYALKNNSVLPLLKKFEQSRLDREYRTKRYLITEIRRDLARLKTLADFYKRKGVKIENSILPEEMREIKSKLTVRPEVAVAGWKMNENNYSDIDRNAVKKLFYLRKRVIWHLGNGENSLETSGKLINIRDLNFTFLIPMGWSEQTLHSGENRKGIIKSFSSIDGKSKIYVASINRKGTTTKEVSDQWIEKMGRTKIKERWGKKEQLDYVWTMSSNRDREVMELYTMKCKDRIIILSGISTKDKYNYFKPKIDEVFKSINPGL